MISGHVNAVVTTGIYCRDGCPASPLPGNVRTYPLDVSAEAAGFRPCLRCRPEQRAQPATWDVPPLVADALERICAGTLDAGTEADLARSCGASPRHLRRLFAEHVGATPTQIAIARRAHFARRLLDETDLPIAQLAYAAGFGSVRTMNETMRRIFRFTPSELRAKRSHPRRELADGGLSLTVPLASPVDSSLLDPARALVIGGVEALEADSYVRTIVLAGNPGVVRLTLVEPDLVAVEAHLPRFDRLIDLVVDVRRFFSATRSELAWTPAEERVKCRLRQQLGIDGAKQRLASAARSHGRRLPVPLLGLSMLSPGDDVWSAVGNGLP
jgi:AraC family transcriptional regulator of adaptative response / DNA-3-methyladenine glycosylase II